MKSATDKLADLFETRAVSFVDLTHPMKQGMPVWPTHPHYCQEMVESYDRGDVACNHALAMSEHTGTHFDAPVHFIRGGAAISDIPVERFFGRMVTIDARACQPRQAVEPEHVFAFEKQHGRIRQGDAVFFHFGWDRFWDDPAQHAAFLADWPGLSRQTCELLVERGARIAGSDCLSIDCFGAEDFPAHNTLLSANILIGENFARLGDLPPLCFLITLPLPIEGGTGSPLRAVAVI
ncbi:cyclase family protein [Mesorhizobium sp.]|jgi:kynurenine formamidase|uniref:cyclase family protein n=1 Tax=Mesorhizobium sp. TaxID=1871066 RepID=UPI003567C323